MKTLGELLSGLITMYIIIWLTIGLFNPRKELNGEEFKNCIVLEKIHFNAVYLKYPNNNIKKSELMTIIYKNII